MTFRNAIGLSLLAISCCLALIAANASAATSKYVVIGQFGSQGSENGEFNGPRGLAVDQATQDVYVADAGNHRIEKFSEDGTFIEAWGWGVSDGLAQAEVCTLACEAGLEGTGVGQFSVPTVVAVDNSGGASNGDVYVGDESSKRVTKFSASGAFLESFEAGTEGPFSAIYGVAVDKHGDLWVYDTGSEVYEFGPTGAEIRQWNTGFGSSYGFAVDGEDHVYALRGNRGMEEFTNSGENLGELDESKQAANGLAADLTTGTFLSSQEKFVAEYVQPVVPSSTPVSTFGEGELSEGTYLAVDSAAKHVYVTEAASGAIDIFGQPAPNPPQIERTVVGSVSDESAALRITINTSRYDTKYYVEYGTDPSHLGATAEAPRELKSNVKEATVNVLLRGLSPGTTYYYRVVAENQNGQATKSGESQRFTTESPGSSALPDKRAYELVSPADKNGGDVGVEGQFFGQAGADGEEINYASLTSFTTEGAPSGKLDEYISQRSPQGWTTQEVTPPLAYISGSSLENPVRGFSEDLTEGVVAWHGAPLTPEASPRHENLYVRQADGSYRLITTTVAPNGSTPSFVGASSDYSHVVFEVNDALTPNAAGESKNVYEWVDGALSLVSIPPGSSVGAGGASAGYYTGSEGNQQNAVSSDGKKVFWVDAAEQLYEYEEGSEAVKVNASARNPSLGDGTAVFDGATPSGEWVFFSDGTALTNAIGDEGGLYGYNTKTKTLTVLDPVESGEVGFQGVVGFSDDGRSLYFVASGVLKTSLEGHGAGPISGGSNLYVFRGGALGFVATLSGSDEGDWSRIITGRSSAVTPDGKDVVFTSVLPLTEYENIDLNTGKADSEVFMYDSDRAELLCLSCKQTNAAPIGASTVPSWISSSYNPNYLSSDGSRVFFNSEDSLAADDTNHQQDVYEWERAGVGGCARTDGCIYLLTPGTNDSKSALLAAGTSASDVFLVTRSKLVSQDHDENYDVYDARVGGGFPAPTTLAPCSGDVCLGSLSAPPGIPSPLSAMPPEPEGKSVKKAVAGLKVLAIKKASLRGFARTGRLTLTAEVSQPGQISARATARVRGRRRQVAIARARAARAGRERLSLTLSRAALVQLTVKHELRVTVTVSYSRIAVQKHLTITLREGRAGR